MDLKKYIRTVKDFPQKGIMFRDISPLLANGEALYETINLLAQKALEADVIIGPDARGFIFGTPVATILKKPFVMIRKQNKLPGPVIQKKYNLEYGSNIIEMQKGAIKPNQKIVIIDDLLATGGTTRAIVDMVQEQGAKVIEVLFVIELTALNGREKYRGIKTSSLMQF